MPMQMGWRWYGEGNDPVTLADIKQIPGVTSIVWALHDKMPGEVWQIEEIAEVKKQLDPYGFNMDVVESVNVHDDIKIGLPTRDQYIENYKQTLRNLAQFGVKVVVYNFMPVFDWTRTDLFHPVGDGSTALFYQKDMIKDDYKSMAEYILNFTEKYNMTFPGWEPERMAKLDELFEAYKPVTKDMLWDNLKYFLEAMMPVCHETDIKLAIHMDDPPWDIFGLPRLMINEEAIGKFVKMVDDPYNCLNICSGSLNANPDNNVAQIVRKYHDRIAFAHIRNIKHFPNGDFSEAAHRDCCGETGIIDILRAFHENGYEGYIRPDHGRQLWEEGPGSCRPGYGKYDRALGIQYMLGVWDLLDKLEAEKKELKMRLPLQHDFKGKVVVITGAGGVLCGVMARAFAKAGAKVAALDLNEEAVLKLAEELTSEGMTCVGYKANVLDPEMMEAVHAQVLADLGSCDILLNGAGGNNPRATTDNEYQHEAKDGMKTFFDLDSAGVDFVFKLNFQGTLIPTQVFAKDMVEKENGVILNISSMNAYIPLTKIPAYSGAKAAISNFTQWLATHFAMSGIRCNAIAPGFLVSNQNRALLFNEDGTPTPRSEKILNGTPMGRFVDADELLGGVFFLCDDQAASAITGVVLPIDAGFAAYSGV